MNREGAQRFERRTLVLRNEIAFVKRSKRARSLARSLVRSLARAPRYLSVVEPRVALGVASVGEVEGRLFDHRHYWPPRAFSCLVGASAARRRSADSVRRRQSRSSSRAVRIVLASLPDRCRPRDTVSRIHDSKVIAREHSCGDPSICYPVCLIIHQRRVSVLSSVRGFVD